MIGFQMSLRAARNAIRGCATKRQTVPECSVRLQGGVTDADRAGNAGAGELNKRWCTAKIRPLFGTKKAPVDVAVTVEIVAFIEPALKRARNHGAG